MGILDEDGTWMTIYQDWNGDVDVGLAAHLPRLTQMCKGEGEF